MSTGGCVAVIKSSQTCVGMWEATVPQSDSGVVRQSVLGIQIKFSCTLRAPGEKKAGTEARSNFTVKICCFSEGEVRSARVCISATCSPFTSPPFEGHQSHPESSQK